MSGRGEVTPGALTDEQIREQLAIEAADGNRINIDICNAALGRMKGMRGQVATFQIAERQQAKQLVCDAINRRSTRSTGPR